MSLDEANTSINEPKPSVDEKITAPIDKFIHEGVDFDKYTIATGTAGVGTWYSYMKYPIREAGDILEKCGYSRIQKEHHVIKGTIRHRPNDKVIVDEFLEKYFEFDDGLITYVLDMQKIWMDYFDVGGPSPELCGRFPIKEVICKDNKNHFCGLMPKRGSLESFLDIYRDLYGNKGCVNNLFLLYSDWCKENKIIPYPLNVIARKMRILSLNLFNCDHCRDSSQCIMLAD